MDETPAMALSDFVGLCEDHLLPRDLLALREALDDSLSSRNPAVQAWREKNTQLQNTVAKTRAHRRRLDPSPFVREHEGFDPSIEQAVDEAFVTRSPLERERALDNCRWALIEEIEGVNTFSLPALLGYAWKLRLAERWTALSEEAGQEEIESMVHRQPGDEGTDASESQELGKTPV